MSDGGPVVRGDKVLWSGSRLITLSPWPCCRGGVFVCTGCVYLDTVTWTGRKVTITIRLLYVRYTIDASPHHGFTMPRCAKRDNPTAPSATMALTPHMRDEGHDKQRHVIGASHAAFQVLTPISESTARPFSDWNLRATVAVRGP